MAEDSDSTPLSRFKRLLLGDRLISSDHPGGGLRSLRKTKALAVFSSDALSSVAYATQEVLIPLAALGAAAMAWSMPIAAGVAALLFIVVACYRRTIDAYPRGGGAYSVVRENLGAGTGLVAGAALLVEYVLTVAVSVSAAAETFASAVPWGWDHRVLLALIGIGGLTLLKLRRAPEEGTWFAVPAYLFLLSMVVLIAKGVWLIWVGDHLAAAPIVSEVYPHLAPFVILRAFSSGSVALTGIEAIADNVDRFEAPEHRNAKKALLALAAALGGLFLGITLLAHVYGVVPQERETLISQLGHLVHGDGLGYVATMFATALILLMAANTGFADFPKISSFLAKDRYLPRQLASLGDRLVFSNGILGLGLVAGVLVWFMGASTHALIPLYAVGVFLTFTLSQWAMVRHHLRKRARGWRGGLVVHGAGAVVTGLVLVVIVWTKFTGGSWVPLLAIALLMLVFKRVHAHYLSVGRELSVAGEPGWDVVEPVPHIVIIPISGVHRGVLEALRYSVTIARDVRACFVELDPDATDRMREEWQRWAAEVPFVVLRSPYRSVVGPLLDYITDVERLSPGTVVTVVVPEFVTSRWWHRLLHNQTAFLIRAALLLRRGKVVTSVRYHLRAG